jgi:ADP-ribosylglycohydrolase
MYGTIIGDVAGSHYELIEGTAIREGLKVPYEKRIKILDRKVPLFDDRSTATDDTILAFAVLQKLLNGGTYEEQYRYYGNRELEIGFDKRGIPSFGSAFEKWIKDNKQGESVSSYGNGASMRVSPIAYQFDDLKTILKETRLSCLPTHNHEEAINCAQMVTSSIFLARKGCTKEEIERYLQSHHGYDAKYNIEYLRNNYIFTSRSKNSVPIAILAFLESTNFEDAIRKAISIGGDTDTIASIAGAISEAYYGIDINLLNDVEPYIPDYMKEDIKVFYKKRGM